MHHSTFEQTTDVSGVYIYHTDDTHTRARTHTHLVSVTITIIIIIISRTRLCLVLGVARDSDPLCTEVLYGAGACHQLAIMYNVKVQA